MIYLSGSINASTDGTGIGLMIQPDSYAAARTTGYTWAADNGCYTAGDRFDPARWLAWLNQLPRDGCLFAVAPDVLGDAAATLTRSAPYLPEIRRLGFPAAYVAQDGWENVEPPWDDFDVLFIGGTTEFKLGAAARAAVADANARGKWVHMGRVNSRRRLRYAARIGCDSVDGTCIAFGPDINTPKVLAWIAQQPLPVGKSA